MKVDGKGNATFSTERPEGSIRFYLGIHNLNTECQGKIKTHSSLSNWNTNHRNNHPEDCGFGGYHLTWHIQDREAFVRKEVVHSDYNSELRKIKGG